MIAQAHVALGVRRRAVARQVDEVHATVLRQLGSGRLEVARRDAEAVHEHEHAVVAVWPPAGNRFTTIVRSSKACRLVK